MLAARIARVVGVVWCVSDGKSRRLRVHRRGERGLPSASSFVSLSLSLSLLRAVPQWNGMDGIHACKLLHALITRRLPACLPHLGVFFRRLAAAPHHVVLSIHFLPSTIVPPTIKAAAPRQPISSQSKRPSTLYARSNVYKALYLDLLLLKISVLRQSF